MVSTAFLQQLCRLKKAMSEPIDLIGPGVNAYLWFSSSKIAVVGNFNQ
jgi:hypothetical protein